MSAPHPEGAADKPVLLLADDDELIVDALMFALEADFDVRTAPSRDAAQRHQARDQRQQIQHDVEDARYVGIQGCIEKQSPPRN